MIGKLSIERDQLRDEVARLQKITSTLRPVTSSSSSSAGGAAGRTPLRSGSAAGTGAAAKGKNATGAVVNGEKEKQQAATNILVIELNAEVRFKSFYCQKI